MNASIIDDRDIVIHASMCWVCRHFQDPNKRRCSAFPDTNIPDDIWLGENLHTSPVPGDNGLLFEDVRK